MNEIYFDNSATTRVCEEAVQAAVAAMREEYGNPSSVHHRGVASFRALKAAREELALSLGAEAGEIFFTSGGTEANNTVVFGAAQLQGKNCRRILVSAVEHASVSEPAKYLQNKGFDVHFIPVDHQGTVRLEALTELLNPETALVSVMQVNNETGSVQPLTEIGQAVRRLAPQAVFHIDGVQSFGRLPVELRQWQADAFSASGHKLHAPKGIGLLWLRKGCSLPPLVRGGGQEKDFRSGTENMPGICAFAAAARVARLGMAEYQRQLRLVKQTLLQRLQAALPEVEVNGQPPEQAAPHILNLSFAGIRSEVLLHYLEEKGLYVSAGSACNSRSSKGSGVLLSMGLPPQRVDSALRFSFCRFNTAEEAEQAATVIGTAVAELRLLMGRKQR